MTDGRRAVGRQVDAERIQLGKDWRELGYRDRKSYLRFIAGETEPHERTLRAIEAALEWGRGEYDQRLADAEGRLDAEALVELGRISTQLQKMIRTGVRIDERIQAVLEREHQRAVEQTG